ncbi:mechanosensitive ion channel [Silicimonas algicola]|uniref:Small-conductance mechanosensitive channel n=1 Tax=Silicimonas algicola TaxID=1826607 RepID=A0A316G6U3_9RHOB|nr:mechanosensitive ion channel domain-containing protein [Silicimonas algicola]AZQ68603.1 mechanosensitive ion channel [Silicimonas algicola]PWK55676.1 small conductance mechanosensitive channel [Silicimonas algicola]
MNYVEELMAFRIGETTVGELLTLQFLLGAVGQVVLAAIILIAGFVIAGFARKRIVRLTDRSRHIDKTMGGFLANLARYAILALTLIFVLQQFGFQTASLVALLGAAGLAIGLALQGVLGGVASGVMLVVFRPIKLGDFVEVNGHTGTVKDISIFTTELATLDNVQVIIPNTEVWSNTIKNYSVYDKRRAEWIFGVSYDADLKAAEQIIRDTIFSDPRSLSEPAPFLQVNNLGDFSVDFLVRCWVPATDYFQYQADMKRAVKEAFDANGIDIPFPTRTVLRADAGS